MKVQSWYIGMLTMFTCSRGTQPKFILCKQHCWPSQPSYAHQTQKSHFLAPPLWVLSGCLAMEEPGNKVTWPTRTEQYAAYAVLSSQWWSVTKYTTINSTVCYQMCFVVLLLLCCCCCVVVVVLLFCCYCCFMLLTRDFISSCLRLECIECDAIFFLPPPHHV